ncbi:MAG: hypothetical protein ACI4Q4_08805, partial [Oscillospiraceae bacterium]
TNFHFSPCCGIYFENLRIFESVLFLRTREEKIPLHCPQNDCRQLRRIAICITRQFLRKLFTREAAKE